MKHRPGVYGMHLILWVSLLAVLLPKVAFSLGFGEIKLHSYLNEPLNAEIELLGSEEIDVNQLLISLASTEDFKKIQLARPYFLTRLRFKFVMHDDRSFIHVTTEENVKQPFLEFLVVLSWPDGRLVRGYTLLLDPAPLIQTPTQKMNQDSAENQMSDQKAMQYFAEKQAKNLNMIKSPTVARNAYGHAEGDDYPINETTMADLRLKNFRNLENLFEQPVEEVKRATHSDELIVRSKAATVELKPVLSVPSLSAEPPVSSQPLVSSFAVNKLLWGSGFALLFVLGLSAWMFRQRRDPVRFSIIKPLPQRHIDFCDDEMQVKLLLAEQYFMVNDATSASEVLDDVLSRGNLNDQEAAKKLLKKNNAR